MSLEVAAMSYDSASGKLTLLETLPTVEEGTPRQGNSTARPPSPNSSMLEGSGTNVVRPIR